MEIEQDAPDLGGEKEGKSADVEGLNKLNIEPFDFSKKEDQERFTELSEIVKREVEVPYNQMRLANISGNQEKVNEFQGQINETIKTVTE